MTDFNRRQFLQGAAAVGVGAATYTRQAAGETAAVRPKFLPLGPDSGLPIKFGSEKNVFCDWWFIDAGYGLSWPAEKQKLTHEGPELMPHGVEITTGEPFLSETPIISGDGPTDGVATGAYCTLIQDGGKYRLWYESYLPGGTSDTSVRICYAESDDGVHWNKPELGFFEYAGSKKNNLVYNHGHGATVFIDPTAKSSERYKMIHLDSVPAEVVNGTRISSFVFGAVSPDGLSWTRLPKPLLKHMSDTQSVAEYDAASGKYVAYLRGWASGRRIIARTESPEFGDFPPPVPVLALGGPQSAPDTDIYTNAYERWPGAANAHLMTPMIYHRSSDQLDLHLAVSRDGLAWQFAKDEPFMKPGAEGSGYEGGINAGRGIVPFGKGLWAFPVWRTSKTHNQIFKPTPERPHLASLWLAKLREDGYMALEAKDDGECWTQPCTFTGSQMLINSWGTPGARVAIEIADADGVPQPGFTLADCDCLYGESLWTAMTWRGKSDISSFRDKVVRFRFSLNRVRVHGFRFA